MILLGLLCTVAALFPLYLKYRVVLTDERCKGKITGIAEQRGGYSVGGYAVKKRAYLVKISGKTVLHRPRLPVCAVWEKTDWERDLGVPQ